MNPRAHVVLLQLMTARRCGCPDVVRSPPATPSTPTERPGVAGRRHYQGFRQDFRPYFRPEYRQDFRQGGHGRRNKRFVIASGGWKKRHIKY